MLKKLMRKKAVTTIAMLAISVFTFFSTSQEVKAETLSFFLEWTGQSTPSSATVVSKDNFEYGRDLTVGFTMNGEPFIGVAYMSAIPNNYTLESGKDMSRCPVGYSNLGYYLLFNIEPAKSYEGQTVKCAVALLV